MQPRVEGAMGAVRIAHCMVRGFFLPCRCANPWDIKPTPQGSRAVTERELWAAPVAAMWPHMGSQQLLCLWLQKMSLFPFVLKLDAVPTKASVAQNTAPPPQPAQPLAPSCHPAQLWELQELKTLAHQEKHLPAAGQEFPLGCSSLSPQGPARSQGMLNLSPG